MTELTKKQIAKKSQQNHLHESRRICPASHDKSIFMCFNFDTIKITF